MWLACGQTIRPALREDVNGSFTQLTALIAYLTVVLEYRLGRAMLESLNEWGSLPSRYDSNRRDSIHFGTTTWTGER